jgi:G3E family GTPase
MGLFDTDKSASRLPVSVITGFLGSGKTTLLNRLLRHDGMGDSAVIINEFGEIGLDHLLVQAIDGEVAVLASGCVCCTLRSDLEQTLRDLLIKRDRGEVPAFSRILVETTGLADPAPIVQLLLNNPLVSHFVRLDAVVTTVDAVNGLRQIGEHAEAVKQTALADRLLLTKTDLAAAATIGDLQKRLAALNPGATLHTVANGEIAPDALFGAALFDPARKSADVRRWINESAYEKPPGVPINMIMSPSTVMPAITTIMNTEATSARAASPRASRSPGMRCRRGSPGCEKAPATICCASKVF